MKTIIIILSLVLLAGCSADYIRLKGPADFNLSATMWSPGFNSRLEESAEIMIKRGGMAINGDGGKTFDDATEEAGGVPPVIPAPDPQQ